MQLSGKNLAYRVYNAGFILNIIKKTKEKGRGAESKGRKEGSYKERGVVEGICRVLALGMQKQKGHPGLLSEKEFPNKAE